MSVSSLREITVGVSALEARMGQFRTGCGLSTLAVGDLAPMTAGRLFDNRSRLRGCVMGRPDVPGSTRIRLLEAGDSPPLRGGGLGAPGPLAIAFATENIGRVQTRLEDVGVRFISPPLLVSPARDDASGLPPGPERYAAFGRTEDGDIIELIEPRSAPLLSRPDGAECSAPLHVSFVVTNLEASLHFMKDVLEHETILAETGSGAPFDRLLGMQPDLRLRLAVPHRPGWPDGRAVFVEFEKKREPMIQIPSLGRGVCRLRYDTTDLHATLGRLPGGGGSLVRGPASIDDPVLGQGLVALVRAPFGILVELWQTETV